MGFQLVFIYFLTLLSLFFLHLVAIDTVSPGQHFTDNGQTLISSGGNFELGFFTPWNSNNRYIGIWFKKVPQQTAYWVANKNNPLTTSSGVLTLTSTGNVLITDNRTSFILWSSNSSTGNVKNPVLKLLDSGNLVVGEGETKEYVWESFENPCDTMIPGMKLGRDGDRETWLTSWKSLTDASSGDYTFTFQSPGLPEMILRRGTQVTFRGGPFDGVRFGDGPALKSDSHSVVKPTIVHNSTGVYYTFQDDESTITRFVLNQTGLLEHLAWSPTRNQWVTQATMQEDNCDNFKHCGANGICNINNEPECKCLDGFKPRIPQDWQRFDWSGGCVPNIPLNCSQPQGFRLVPKVKLPASTIVVNQTSIECEEVCLRNCSCVAYAKVSGCVVWFSDLLDIKKDGGGGQDLFLRLDASQLSDKSNGNGNGRRKAQIASISVISGALLLGLVGFLVWRTWKRSKVPINVRNHNLTHDYSNSTIEVDLELPLFDFATISTATNDFSPTNKIGEGGFGPVHKGVLSDGQEIAVKRLSKDSGQGIQEFKNEVILYFKLQHRNLVKLFGSCIDGEEIMLIYEYLPNNSLDQIIFDETCGALLDWRKRYDIIAGIARGLLYLHRDSRLRIIHRDLKASNILLDSQMAPKISDFGLAKTFGGDQSVESTNRIIGTFGYMSPEYAIDGLFSIKSDVFSFGVLVLEIVSGKRNRGYINPHHSLNLLGHAWKLWNEGEPLELVDECIVGSISMSEALRCIQLGLLCVQKRPEDRPTMSTVVLMLDCENPILPQPNEPGFYTGRSFENSPPDNFHIATTSEITITLIHGR